MLLQICVIVSNLPPIRRLTAKVPFQIDTTLISALIEPDSRAWAGDQSEAHSSLRPLTYDHLNFSNVY